MLDIQETLSKLSAQDKILLLSGSDFWHTHPVESLGIPRVRVSDGPNGIRGIKFFGGVPSNCFPCATGLGATWDTKLLEELGQQMGKECAQKGAHVWLGPTLNIQRSPLGGRGFESYSEDPYVSGKLSAAIIRGCQSQGVAATPKHFVCNDQELDRNSNSSELTMRALREIYLKAFQIAIREGEPWAIMTAYNRVNGLHVSENPLILQDILRNEWGWKGMTMSDWFGTYSTVEALKAGLDLEMPGGPIFRGTPLTRAIASGKLQSSDLDESAGRVLQLVNRAIASKIPFEKPEESGDSPETRALLKKAAQEAVVLIKNEGNMLPLTKEKTKKIALIGPSAKTANISGGGSASMKTTYAVSPKEGIEALAAKHGIEVVYSVGAQASRYLPLVDPLVQTADGKKGHLKLDCYKKDPDHEKGQEPLYSMLSDTAVGLLADGIPDYVPQQFYMRVAGSFTPDENGEWEFGLAVAGQADLYLDDKLLVSNSKDQQRGDIFFGSGTVEVKNTMSMKAGQKYKIEMKWSNLRPVVEGADLIGRGGFRIGASKIIDAKQAVKDAVEVAKSCDAVIVVAGLSGDFESEGFDRPDMKLPKGVDDMIKQVLDVNPNSVVVIQSGTQCEMPWYGLTKAVVQAFYGGNESGNGIASVLFGEHNPSAKLPLTFPIKLEDVPSHPYFPGVDGKSLYNEDVFVAYRSLISKIPPTPVLASFGHGLSYTTFEISNAVVSEPKYDASAASLGLSVKVTVKNTGKIAGGEVVQCYISSSKCPLPRPALELAAFSKVHLEAGESKTVEMTLDRGAFSYWNDTAKHGNVTGSWAVEKAIYTVMVGNSLDNLTLSKEVIVKESFTWLGL